MPRGSWTAHDDRQYEAILASERARGTSEKDAKRIAAATVNKRRAAEGRGASSSANPGLGEWDFASWQRGVDDRMRKHRERVRRQIAQGRSVVEHMGDKSKVWRLGVDTFVAPYNRDPDYLADHLMSRHRGFGYDHTIGAVRYHLGEPVQLVRCTKCGAQSWTPEGAMRCPVCREA